MTTTDYEAILREALQLPLEERRRLASALMVGDAAAPADETLVASLLALEPLEPAAWDEMERVIEEGCERIDPRDWVLADTGLSEEELSRLYDRRRPLPGPAAHS